MTNLFNSSTLIASLLWGSIGGGLFVFGWKQKSAPPLVGGLLMVAVSYFAESGLYMSILSLIIMAGMYGWKKRMD
jgi:hypothetical protein